MTTKSGIIDTLGEGDGAWLGDLLLWLVGDSPGAWAVRALAGVVLLGGWLLWTWLLDEDES